MRRRLCFAALLVMTNPALAETSALTGEWSIDAESCAAFRTAFAADGTSRSLVQENGAWTTLAQGRFEVEDGVLIETITEAAAGVPPAMVGQSSRTEIVESTPERLTLMPLDPERRALVDGPVTMQRCPPRG